LDKRDIALDVWQFVRIMVQLEATAKGGAAWFAWHEAWEELDAKLESLRHRDPRSFGELMMDQQVVVPLERRGQLAEVISAAQAVIGHLDAATNDRNLDRQRRADLRMERSEMSALVESLRQRSSLNASDGGPKRSLQKKRKAIKTISK
jgi:hypothetical protein